MPAAITSTSARGLQSASTPERSSGLNSALHPRRFVFERDSFAFANELIWEYHFDPASGQAHYTRREPTAEYAHRCFVVARAARQFLYHARFDPGASPFAEAEAYLGLIRQVVARNPRRHCSPGEEVVFPGYVGLREFSQQHSALLKAECGGSLESYFLRSHWRMIFPISRRHQMRTAERLLMEIRRGNLPIVHLVRFPQLTINHGMVLFGVNEQDGRLEFESYDPNEPASPTRLTFDPAKRWFSLPATRYWPGGQLNVIEIYRGWLM